MFAVVMVNLKRQKI